MLVSPQDLGYHNKNIAKIGNDLWDDNISYGVSARLPIDTAMTIMADSDLGRNTYTNQRKLLKSSGYDIFHPWRAIREHQYSFTPDIKPLKEPYTGVAFSFKDAMEITAKRILSLPDVQNKSPNLSN